MKTITITYDEKANLDQQDGPFDLYAYLMNEFTNQGIVAHIVEAGGLASDLARVFAELNHQLGRDEINPDALALAQVEGFEPFNTGGNVLVFRKDAGHGISFYVSSECAISQAPDEAKWQIGLYSNDGDSVVVDFETTLLEAIRLAEHIGMCGVANDNITIPLSRLLPPVGTRLMLKEAVDRFPNFWVPARTTGTLVAADAEEIRMKLDRVVEGAEEWDNCLVWYPNNTPGDVTDFWKAVKAIALLP